jgi:hypothetical protein
VSRDGDILQGINSKSGPSRESAGPSDIQSGPPELVPDPWIYSPDPQGWSWISTCASRTPGMESGSPPYGSGSPTGESQGPRTEHTRALNRTQTGSGTDICPDLIWCGPVRMRHCSPPRRRPDTATWPTARDVSQRAEPDIRPPGYATPAFIADKARRLYIPLTGDVPPRHLMRPVHSADRRRPVHSAGGVPVLSAGRQHTHTVACTALIITRTLAGKLPLCVNAAWAVDIRAPGDCTDVTYIGCSRYSIYYVPGPTCRGSAPLYVPPLSYKREGTQRYKADPTQAFKSLRLT